MELLSSPEAAEKFRDAILAYFRETCPGQMVNAIMKNDYTEINKSIRTYCSKIPVEENVGFYFFYGNFPIENSVNMHIENILNLKSVKFLLIREIISNSAIDDITRIIDSKEEMIILNTTKSNQMEQYLQNILSQSFTITTTNDKLRNELNRKNLELAAFKSSSFEPGKIYTSTTSPRTPPGLNTTPTKDFDSSVFGIIPQVSPALELLSKNIWKF